MRQVLRQFGLDAGRDETVTAIRQRLLIRPLNRVARDRDFLDAAVFQLLLELAVGNRLHLPRGDPDLAEPQDADHRDDQVPDIEVNLLLFFHRCSQSGWIFHWTIVGATPCPIR